MAQNVTIAGASYLGVPRIEMPKTGGGTAVFVDTSDANAAAGDITKGKTAYVGGTKITGTLEASSSGGAKETWVIKSNAGGELVTTQISFTSNGQKFTSIGANGYSGTFVILYYDNNEVAGYDPGIGGVYEFDNEAYRKLTFDTPPTGALLTWLQANAVKQPDDTAVQDTKALTITSNGTVSVTPDAPYDALKKVDVTVDVVADVPLVTVTFKATQFGDEIHSPGEDSFDEMKRMVISAFVGGNILLKDMYAFSQQLGGTVFPFDVAVPQGSSVTIGDNSLYGGGVSATNALVARTSAESIRNVYTIYNITDGATITIDVT